MRTTPLLLALALLACSCTNCASTPQVVKDDAHIIAGCDTADVSAIVIANGRILADVASLRAGGAQAGVAAVDILTQLAQIHGAWAHCRATATSSLPPAGAPPASGVVRPEATLPPAASPLAPATTSTVMLVDGARTLPPLVIHDGQGRRIVFSRVGVGATGAHPHAP